MEDIRTGYLLELNLKILNLYFMTSYSNIKADLQNKTRREQYMILLQTAEWANFRIHILDRHGHACEQCRAPEEKEIEMSEDKKAAYKAEYDKQLAEFNWRKANFTREQWIESLLDGTYIGLPAQVVYKQIVHTSLQIHHKLYFENKLPWQYSAGHIQILCSNCHTEAHRTTRIYTYQDESMQFRKEEAQCERCSGTGYLPQYHYHDDGICYSCGGLGILDGGVPQWVAVS
jgi:hypothetical protein